MRRELRCASRGSRVSVVAVPRVRPQDAAHVLDETPFERDRRGEEEGVRCRAVEALADVGPGGHGELRWAATGPLPAGRPRPISRSTESADPPDISVIAAPSAPAPHPYWVGSPPRIAVKLESSPRWKKMRPRSEPSSSSTAQPRPLAGSHSSLP